MEEKESAEEKPEYTFDLSSIEVSSNLVDLHQEGNYLVGITETGVRFRQHIPAGKVLDKKNGKWFLKDMEIVHSS